MVKIINGEIYADDDPRLQQLQQPQPPTQRPANAASAGSRSATAGAAPAPAFRGFDFSAPPLRVVPPAPGAESLAGLPDLEIFGVRLTPYAILAMAGLATMFGWRGLLFGLVLYYVYLANQNTGPPTEGTAGVAAERQRSTGAAGNRPQQQQAPSGQVSQGPMDFLQRYLEGPRPRSQAGPQQQGEGVQTPGGRGGGTAGGGGGDGGYWSTLQGTGKKLGGNKIG